MGLADGNFGLLGGLAGGGMAGSSHSQRSALDERYRALLGIQQQFEAKPEKPKTIRQKLQSETDEWLKDVFV
jgi:hypothetical protein